MPQRPKRPCLSSIRCPNLVTPPERYCPDHQTEKHIGQREYDRQRGSFRQRGYTSQYDKVKAIKKKRNPICEPCASEGIVIPLEINHHIIPVEDGGAMLDIEAMLSVCRACHGIIHRGIEREKKKQNKKMLNAAEYYNLLRQRYPEMGIPGGWEK